MKAPVGTLGRLAAVVGIVAAITFLCFRILPVNATTVGFTYLVAILFIAARWGLLESAVGSFASVLCFNFFFFEPIGTFTIADPQNWVALFAFLATAITASQLSTQVKRRAQEALARREEMEGLYALSRSILLIEPSQSVPKQIADQTARSIGASAVTLYDRSTTQFYRAGPEDFPGLDEQLLKAANEGTLFQNENRKTLITSVRLGSQPIASLGVSGVELSDSALQSLANLVAIGLERSRAHEAAARAEAARHSDELKSTLLDAIAHEFQTPLTSIKASTTALLSDRPPPPEQQREFMKIVDQEAARLSGLVTDAIQMARLDANRIQLHPEAVSVHDFVQSVLATMSGILEDRAVTVDIAPDVPALRLDRQLMDLALRQLLSNAVKYSPPSSPIGVTAGLQDGRVHFSVRDSGPGIPKSELTRVFERFYRGPESRGTVAGAGLGLAIAKDIVEAHGGEISGESAVGRGSVFRISLPCGPEGRQE